MPTDVVGANAAGAKAVWLSRRGKGWTDGRARPTFIARDLAEVAGRLVSM
jgi:FMN phosphatase YigB (HAD superfamily)